MMKAVCLLSGKKNGYQLEKLLEPHLIKREDGVIKRSCKWDRYIKGVTPDRNGMDIIKENFPEAINIYNLILWPTLRAKVSDFRYWDNFYLSVPEEVQKLCYRYKSYDNASSYRIGKQKSDTLDRILRIGNEDALACLIALLRENVLKQANTDYDYIETAIFNLIFWELSNEPFFSIRHQIMKYIEQHIFISDGNRFTLLRESPWNLTDVEIDTRLMVNQKNIILAEELGLIATNEERREFIYWKFKGNSFLIANEMTEAFGYSSWELPHSEKGLKWLIHKLNTTRPGSKKLNEDVL